MSDWDPRPTRTMKRRRSSSGPKEISPKQPKASGLKTLIIDNGSYTIKAGYSTDTEPQNIPNCIMKAKSERKRLFVGKQIDECRDCSGLYFLLPCERGYITRWEVQKPVWDHVFSKNVCPIEENPVVVTQPLINFKSIQDCMDEIFFEEYEVQSLFRCNPADLAYLHYAKDNKLTKSDACLVVDTGFSFTHVVPYIRGCKFLRAIRRLNVGGKLLTNHLKDIISYRQYNVMEETYVINQVKEDTCYVCSDIKQELAEAAKPLKSNSIVKNYVLPDFNMIRRGFIQDPNKKEPQEESYQILRLNNERFVVPEILFHPSDIGMKSMGIAEAVVKSIMSSPKEHRQSLAKNIILVGGNCKFPGFKVRMYAELRSLLPDSWEVKLFQDENPITYPWKGGRALLRTHDFRSHLVTKKDYEELGSTITQERFNNFMLDDSLLEPEKEDKPKETYRYLRTLEPRVFGKNEIINSVSDIIKVDNEEQKDEGGSGEREDVNKIVEEGEQELNLHEGGRKQGRPMKNKGSEELLPTEEEEVENDLLQSSELFPFGNTSYL
ncbi:actin-related protein 6 [Euwallacea fornicatus]|uniref:actin-related protein 6 n=1 Tax=Euwallacea fornicatus TaxID=995702 RepID=UPI0033904C68